MNRLAQESSPYLLQHKNNPVDWYPWGDEALEKARSEDKPILLSIGYSACHWCHVMEHESFENPAIAQQMNENFVSIKVDREERPDLDQIYQNVAQAMTRSGGWPLTVFLTPDLKPFFGGTYYPPEDRYGRPGFPRVLQALSQAYRNERDAVVENARRLTEVIQSLESVSRADKPALPTREALREAAAGLVDLVDWGNGGFGGAPKFPNSMMIDLIWRVGSSFGDERMTRAALLTLEKMASGGIYDQLGGGFHRYSVDEHWSVPHFEKMLYDNGLLLRAYSQVLLSGHRAVTAENRELFVRILRETVDYLLREMRSNDGAFFAAQDADSEGEEGKFFVWDRSDVETILKGQELEAFCFRYGIADGSNFEHGKTVLYLSRSVAEVAREIGRSETETAAILERARTLVFTARSRRIAPGTDNKVLASWNGLAISGLAWAAQALRDAGDSDAASRAHDAAKTALGFLARALADREGRLLSTFQGGQAKLNGYLDDYAFLSMAALDLARFETDGKAIDRYVGFAELWMGTVLKHFRDEAGGGFFFTSDDHEKLIQRPKTIYDQAIPSGTAVTLECLAALAEIDRGGRGAAFAEEVERELGSIFPSLMRNPFGFGEMYNASLLAFEGPIVVSGLGAHEAIRHPHVFQRYSAEDANALLTCHRRTCSLPMKNIEELRAAISEYQKTS